MDRVGDSTGSRCRISHVNGGAVYDEGLTGAEIDGLSKLDHANFLPNFLGVEESPIQMKEPLPIRCSLHQRKRGGSHCHRNSGSSRFYSTATAYIISSPSSSGCLIRDGARRSPERWYCSLGSSDCCFACPVWNNWSVGVGRGGLPNWCQGTPASLR